MNGMSSNSFATNMCFERVSDLTMHATVLVNLFS